MEAEAPFFSIITITYNDLNGLCGTYESIRIQRFCNFEWVVVDGGSRDGTVNFLSVLEAPFLIWASGKDNGIYDAMNYGVSMCSGRYVVFMNAGDMFYDSETLSKVADALSAGGPVADILFSGAMLSFSGSTQMAYRPPRRVEKSLWHGLPANHQATVYRAVLLNQTPYDLQYSLCGDYYIVAKLMSKGARVLYLDEPLTIFGVGGLSYHSWKQLFLEPYYIQRDVLGLHLRRRLVSMVKRFISTVGIILLNQPKLNAVLITVLRFYQVTTSKRKEGESR